MNLTKVKSSSSGIDSLDFASSSDAFLFDSSSAVASCSCDSSCLLSPSAFSSTFSWEFSVSSFVLLSTSSAVSSFVSFSLLSVSSAVSSFVSSPSISTADSSAMLRFDRDFSSSSETKC